MLRCLENTAREQPVHHSDVWLNPVRENILGGVLFVAEIQAIRSGGSTIPALIIKVTVKDSYNGKGGRHGNRSFKRTKICGGTG